MQQPILSKVLSDIELRNYSEATKDLYLRTCVRYLEFLGGRPQEATDEFDVRAFSQHLRCDCGLAPKTVKWASAPSVVTAPRIGCTTTDARGKGVAVPTMAAIGTNADDRRYQLWMTDGTKAGY